MQLFIDMDGVLADFDTGYEAAFGVRPSKAGDTVDWAKVTAYPGFYAGLPPMSDIMDLWDFVAPYRPIVLTGVPWSVAEAPDNKRAWVRKHLGADVEVRCCKSAEKCHHAAPGDILVDDWDKYRHLWLATGGLWVTHTSAANSIKQLRLLMTY